MIKRRQEFQDMAVGPVLEKPFNTSLVVNDDLTMADPLELVNWRSDIEFGHDGMTVVVGAGQRVRVDSSNRAIFLFTDSIHASRRRVQAFELMHQQ